MRRAFLAFCLLALSTSTAWAWGQEGHSIIAEIAQRRLSSKATAEVARLLGANHSLASIASWADDIRDSRPETYNWHFVDLPINADHYDPATQCVADEKKGDCIIAELARLSSEVRCAPTDAQKRDALRFAVHFIGDIHQPLHTVLEAAGGNGISVEVKMRGTLMCKGEPCSATNSRANFHRVWDTTLIQKTTWDWGAYVDRLEEGWLVRRGERRRRWNVRRVGRGNTQRGEDRLEPAAPEPCPRRCLLSGGPNHSRQAAGPRRAETGEVSQ